MVLRKNNYIEKYDLESETKSFKTEKQKWYVCGFILLYSEPVLF